MKLLDEVTDFWHGNYNFDEKYSLAMNNVYLSTCHPPIDSYSKAIKGFNKSNLISAKNKFINFAGELEEKINETESLSKCTLVKSLIKNISERR